MKRGREVVEQWMLYTIHSFLCTFPAASLELNELAFYVHTIRIKKVKISLSKGLHNDDKKKKKKKEIYQMRGEKERKAEKKCETVIESQ